MSTSRLIAVAVPIPALGLLTYAVPADLPMPCVGARVVVPVGPRTLTGVMLGAAAAADTAYIIKPIKHVVDDHAFVPPDVVKLTEWVSEYYLAGPGAALAAALPPHGLTARTDRFKTVRIAMLTAAGIDAAERLTADSRLSAVGHRLSRALAESRSLIAESYQPKFGKRQCEALRLLNGSPDGLAVPALTERGITTAALTRLRGLGLIAMRNDRVDRDPFEHAVSAVTPAVDRQPTEEQQRALEALLPLTAAATFKVALLHGVTGSGKTEVYLRLAEAVRAGGRGVLMLVPEIALTPQVAALFRARFGDAVAIQHSGLSDGERHDQWHRIRRGDVDVVVGTRSAVFAPLANPGLIIVDEEHDASYKQDETPRYSGRDVAIMRGKSAGALVVLGSATPTMESFTNALEGKYALVSLQRRVLDRPLPRVSVVSMREEMAERGEDVVLSRVLVTAIQERLDRREQSLILLNRRGFATAVICRQCNATLECPNCSINLTVHSRTGGLVHRGGPREGGWHARCHYCNFVKTVPNTCEKCAAPYMERVGFGTARVEADIRQAFPSARIARVDRDTVRRKGSLVETLARVGRREVDVLIGTQMIAKGHDFPDVTLVGVISADVGLGLADFRSNERTFQLLTQVAGRAGRGELPGEAMIQSLLPKHYAITLACTQDYRAFYDAEITYRRTMRYPPQVAMVNVVVRGRTFDEAMRGARDLADAARGARGFALLGPAPAPLARLRGEHRAQFFLKGVNRRAMRDALQLALARKPALAKRVSIDVDPLSML